jgi:hypothetical protein
VCSQLYVKRYFSVKAKADTCDKLFKVNSTFEHKKRTDALEKRKSAFFEGARAKS